MDLGEACRKVISEAEAFHPDCTLRLEVAGDPSGSWDEGRIRQRLSNPVENAIRHGSRQMPATVSARGEESRLVVAVHNEGRPISESRFRTIFEPLARGERD